MIRGGLAALVSCVAFAAAAAPAGVTVTVRDDTGEPVSLVAPAARVVSLAPNATEILFAAGAGRAVVGVVASSDWPAAARSLPRVGDASALDLERIVALRPDLVVTWPYTTPAQVTVLRARGIAVFVINSRSVEDIANAIERVGRLAGDARVAGEAAASLRARHATLSARYAGRAPLRVFYEVWPTPLVTLGGEHIVSRAIETCGGRNVFAQWRAPAPNVTVEAVIAARPEIIVAGADDGRRPEWLEAWRQWSQLPAVAAGNLYTVDADLLHRPGPRFVEGVAKLCETIERARHKRRAEGSVNGQ